MKLSWLKSEDKDKKEKPVVNKLRERIMPFNKALKEIHSSLDNKYEIFHFAKESLIFIKYDKKEGLYYLIAEGTAEEILNVQLDKKVKESIDNNRQ
ncbi:hypothetical protein GW950_01450 [Candidatus Wolfebacteria bacterium]|nr:hypothetical protein [Candidatus Wolfebacteria bacterium]